jgi:hypothetical protein
MTSRSARSADSGGRHWLRALGRAQPPATFYLNGNCYTHRKTFKHDFFAATALYDGPAGPVVLKIGHLAPLLGLPCSWIGRFLAQHEAQLYGLLRGTKGVPHFVGRWGPTGIVHEFIAGAPLSKDTPIHDGFFPALARLIEAIHLRKCAYVDLEKRENILYGEDGQPYLIDFQISLRLPAGRLLRLLQASDRYHLLKHWRRLRPDQLTSEQTAEAQRPPPWIAWHRLVFRPVTRVRRQVLVWLGERTSARVRSPG